MQVEQVNAMFREMFNELIDDSYKKSHVCGVTLGESNVPQFDAFMKGNDFGLKPLKRIIENRGYKFNIVITAKDDADTIKRLADLNCESMKNYKEKMVKILDNEASIRAASIPKTGIIAEISSDLFDEIVA